MGRLISLNARVSANAPSSDADPVLLVTIRHPSFTAPIRLSSDPTVRISVVPLLYGTKHAGHDHLFVLVGSVLPDDQEDSPPKTTLAFDNVDKDMAAILRGVTPGTYASVDLDVVLAGSPEVIEASFTNLRGVRGSYDAAQVSLDISREPFTSEPWPDGRMTSSRFPSLFQ